MIAELKIKDTILTLTEKTQKSGKLTHTKRSCSNSKLSSYSRNTTIQIILKRICNIKYYNIY